MADTPNTGIPYVPEGTQDPAAGLNLALNVIDALLQSAVIDMDLTAPPGSESDGDLHIVAASATGAWAGQDNNLARYVAEGDFWQFYEAGVNVHLVLNKDDGALYAWNGSAWVSVGGIPEAPEDGTGYVRKDGAWAAESGGGGSDNITIVTEASTSTMDPATHSGRSKLILAADDVTFDSTESYTAGDVFNICATSAIDLLVSGVTLTPPSGGTTGLSADMTVSVVMISSTAGRIIGQTVAA